MLGYFWKRFTASEGAVSNIAHIQINDYESAIAERDIRIESLERHIAQQDDMIGNLAEEIKHLTAQRDAQIESLKRSLTHKTDLADSYKGATERRDERIKELERQNNEYIVQYAMKSDSVTAMEQQLAEANRKLSAIEAIFSVNLSPKGDKNDGDTAEYPSPKMFDSRPYGE